MKAFKFFAFGMLLVASLAAQSLPAENYTVPQLLELAVQRNPELRAFQLESESSQLLVDQASRWSNPNFEIGGARKEERDGNTNFTKVGISKAIEFPSRSQSRTLAAKARSEAAHLYQAQSELELRALVLKLIYAYKVANEKANHAKERLERFKTVGTYLRSRVFASPQKGAEAAIVRTKLMVLGRDLRELEANRKTAWTLLNLYLGLDSEPKINVQWYRSAPNVEFDKFIAELQQANPNLRMHKAKLAEIENELKLSRSDSWPGLNLAGSYESGSGANPEKIYGLGVSFPLPIFDLNRGGIRRQETLYRAEKERGEWAIARAKQELSSAVERYNSAKASLAELAVDEIAKLEKEMETIDLGFKRGQVDLLTYIEADAEHAGSLNAILDSQIDFVDAQNALHLLVGRMPRTLE